MWLKSRVSVFASSLLLVWPLLLRVPMTFCAKRGYNSSCAANPPNASTLASFIAPTRLSGFTHIPVERPSINANSSRHNEKMEDRIPELIASRGGEELCVKRGEEKRRKGRDGWASEPEDRDGWFV